MNISRGRVHSQRVQCRTATATAPSVTPLRLFDQYPRPLARIGAVTVILGLGLALPMAWVYPYAAIEARTELNPSLVIGFLLNLIVFIAVWTVYFTSPLRGLFGCQSLRTLLHAETVAWTHEEAADEQDVNREHAGATLTAQAVFIAISVLIINMIADQRSLLNPSHGHEIENLVALGALAAASLSFVLLLISLDAIDTTFNTFTDRAPLILDHFFRLASKLKYYGFVLSFLSLVLFVFTISPAVASIAMASFLCFGYSYWFPAITAKPSLALEPRLFRGSLVLLNIIVFINAF